MQKHMKKDGSETTTTLMVSMGDGSFVSSISTPILSVFFLFFKLLFSKEGDTYLYHKKSKNVKKKVGENIGKFTNSFFFNLCLKNWFKITPGNHGPVFSPF